MKRLYVLFALFFIIAAKSVYANPNHGEVSFNYFYNTLSPYGNWIELDDNMYAWKPYNVSPRWSPYTMGRWVWSDYGWYWDSYEPYGWAVYHYGRWYNDDYYGWMWIPDYQWGPSWVEWRYDDDYVGWAPLPPYAVFRIGVGIHFTYDWYFPYHHWNYISVNHFCDNNPYHYFVNDRVKYRIHERSRYSDDFEYRDGRVINRGVDHDFIERRGRVKIVERNVNVTTRYRDNEGMRNNPNRDRVEVFRPDENEVNRYRNADKANIKRTERRVSLDVNRVELGARSRERNTNAGNGREVIQNQQPVNGRNNNEVKREDNSRNVQREENRREEQKVFQVPSRNENARIERERRNEQIQQERKIEQPRVENRYEQPQVEKRNQVQENRNQGVEQKREERRVESPRQNEPRQQPQVRERRNDDGGRGNSSRQERRESGGNGRSRERR